MTEKDLARIETKLKIALPTAYRQLMLARSAELKAAGCFNDSLSSAPLLPAPRQQARRMADRLGLRGQTDPGGTHADGLCG